MTTTVDYKSAGMLIDEWITTSFKLEAKYSDETVDRYRSLELAIMRRVGDRLESIQHLVDKLRIVLWECWNAQETVMKFHNLQIPASLDSYTTINDWITVGQAGIRAQKTNAARNKLIREIDTALGEASITALDKTY